MTAARKIQFVDERQLTARDVEKYLPIVRRTATSIAQKVPRTISLDDLLGYGWIGLVEAFRRASASMDEEEFMAYSLYRIRGSILDHLRSLDTRTRASRAASRRVARTIDDLTKSLRRAPEEEEVADALGQSLDEYRDTLLEIDRAGMSRLEMLDIDRDVIDFDGEAPDGAASRRQLEGAVARAIGELPTRLQNVLALYYTEGRTLREIGAILEVTESRVCQLHSEAIHRLRAAVGRE
ncbi:MAG: FliA/WhiG family RNA polymerase sigma factor [Labilithrix sp.]|nr:FliA/WhiG family RNA polymerase sigma factor [Labilithrix sp.]